MTLPNFNPLTLADSLLAQPEAFSPEEAVQHAAAVFELSPREELALALALGTTLSRNEGLDIARKAGLLEIGSAR